MELCSNVMWQPIWEENLGKNAYVWLSPFSAHLKLSQHCLSAILQYESLENNNNSLDSIIIPEESHLTSMRVISHLKCPFLKVMFYK